MGRPRRVNVGGLVYHALNRASGRATLFEGPADYRQFERVLEGAVQLIAAMRKLLVILNAMLRDGQPWRASLPT